MLGLDRRIDAVLDPPLQPAPPPGRADRPMRPEPTPAPPPTRRRGVRRAPARDGDGRRAAPRPTRSARAPAPPTVRPEDDAAADDDDDAEDAGLAGADLVARELGGTVIGEFGPG